MSRSNVACRGAAAGPAPRSANGFGPYVVFRVSMDVRDGDYDSIEAALSAARRLRRKAPHAAIKKIEVGDGDYYTSMPLTIGPDLSGFKGAPTQIIAAPGARPRLISGRPLQLRWRPYRDGIFQAHIENN